MAIGKGEIIGTSGLIERLLVPRLITRLALGTFFVILASIFWKYLDYKFLAYISNATSPLCLICTVAVWSMRDKVDVVLTGDHLTSSSFKSAKISAKELRSRSMRLSAWLTVCTLLVSSAGIASATVDAVYQWMVIAGGFGLGEALYGYLLANSWEEQLRAQRDALTLRQKQYEEQHALMERIELSAQASKLKLSPSPMPSTLSLGKDVH